MQGIKNNILLINIPPIWLKTPPLGIGFLYSYLKDRGFKVEILDLNALLYKEFRIRRDMWNTFGENYQIIRLFENSSIKEEVLKRINEFKYIGFSCFQMNMKFCLYLAEIIKELYPEKTIIFGGPQILFDYYHDNLKYLQVRFSKEFFVIGEGMKSLERIMSCEFSDNRGKVFIYQELENLDAIGLLRFLIFDMDVYPCIGLVSSLGCYKRCVFCSECFLYKKVRHFSISFMEEQLKYINTYFKNRFISFQDSMFNADLKYLDELMEIFLKNSLNFKWEAQIGVNKIPLYLLKKMKQAGCMKVFIGVESFSDRVLSLMNKGYTREDVISLFDRLKKAGIFYEISLMVNFPGETEEDFQQTLNFIKKYSAFIPKIAQISNFVVYPPSIWAQKNKDKTTNTDNTRILRILKVLEEKRIRFTPSFINNLKYASDKNN